MPQTTQHSLIHVLLLWITILSIVQVVFITLFFTTGHHSWALSSSTVTPAMQVQANITPSAPSELMGKVEMLTFKATKANRKITWVTKNQDQILVSKEEDGTVLKIKKDGYFLLNLQVTLSSCNYTLGPPYVSLTSKDTVILWGRINTNTCSTGLLGKVEELNANDSLEVTIEPPNDYDMIDDESLNHLDIVFLPRN
ncbi:Thiol:disulfide interchange protein DsbD [Dissostichus eleginoides]|uniref:Thiol:disulfide interchange protein DsbD n=1 Tax=Dissostichus eleginoides TaxID=100907 RepID=A0AAD9B6W5_DISEL|nr:Thiol:disulfide interchange protein DsbD [Dissostichus eleginoides]